VNCGAWGSIAPPIAVDIVACLLEVKVSRAENNNKAIGATVARLMCYPRASHAAVKPVRFAEHVSLSAAR
jgi:hypothetical protein